MARSKEKPPNPICAAVARWTAERLLKLPGKENTPTERLLAEAPKRWVVYQPMVLLPSGSFTSALWKQTLAQVDEASRDDLWVRILRNVAQMTKERVTHLAANEGIPLTVTAAEDAEPSMDLSGHPHESSEIVEKVENVLRSPTGLHMLYGDFGPSHSKASGNAVTEEDFAEAFWVSTKQNGIQQTWAPRWTMFSRGNIKEKARLLDFHEKRPSTEKTRGLLCHRVRTRAHLERTWAVDLYAGIGYFVLSYAKLGMRVLCWEINPWSVQGLRRGAEANGWSVRVVQGDDLKRPTPDVLSDADNIIVFLESNQEAARRVRELRPQFESFEVSHVNCGLLPTSADSWRSAWDILGEPSAGGWLHLHENVGIKDIDSRRQQVQDLLDGWDASAQRDAKVEHVELVKTFAPDVWHCVFDVYITISKPNNMA